MAILTNTMPLAITHPMCLWPLPPEGTPLLIAFFSLFPLGCVVLPLIHFFFQMIHKRNLYNFPYSLAVGDGGVLAVAFSSLHLSFMCLRFTYVMFVAVVIIFPSL